MENTEEIWMPVLGYEGIYSISNLGRLKSHARSFVAKTGYKKNYSFEERVINSCPDKQGYKIITLKDSIRKLKPKTFKIHRLVAAAFIGEIPEGMVINHKNGIKDDNYVGNLEIVTRSQNTRHAFGSGLMSHKGIKNANARLSESDIIDILKLSKQGYTAHQIAHRFNIRPAHCKGILNGKRWRHITNKK